MGAASRSRAEAEFSEGYVVNETLALYDRVRGRPTVSTISASP
jgi:hypothetical protein